MFSKSKDTLPASTYAPISTFNFTAGKDAPKKATPEELRERMILKAKVFVEESRGRLFTEQKKIQDFASSNYWFYGYFIGSLSATMMGSMALSSRVPFISRYLAFASLAGGYFGATCCMGIHQIVLSRHFVKAIQQEIDVAKKLDEETGHTLGEYEGEVRRLEGFLDSLRSRHSGPNTAAMGGANHENETAEELAARYAKNRNWNFHNTEKKKLQ